MQLKNLANSVGCILVLIAAEALWSLIAERYHDPLRRFVNKLIVDHPAAPLPLFIDYANLAMSHTVGPEGFTPSYSCIWSSTTFISWKLWYLCVFSTLGPNVNPCITNHARAGLHVNPVSMSSTVHFKHTLALRKTLN